MWNLEYSTVVCKCYVLILSNSSKGVVCLFKKFEFFALSHSRLTRKENGSKEKEIH